MDELDLLYEMVPRLLLAYSSVEVQDFFRQGLQDLLEEDCVNALCCYAEDITND